MARDYEDLQNLDQLDDREIRDLVRERLAEHNGLDIDDILVTVQNGAIALTGRVGTEGERRIADHILTDVLGVREFTNDLVIDPIRRAESPMDIDEHLAEEDRSSGLLLGDRAVVSLLGSRLIARHPDETSLRELLDLIDLWLDLRTSDGSTVPALR